MLDLLPQGTSDLESLRYRLRPNFWPPQGIGQGTTIPIIPMSWIDDNNNQFETDQGLILVFVP